MDGDASRKAVVGDQSEPRQGEEAAAVTGQSAAHDGPPSKHDATAAEGDDEMEAVELNGTPAVDVSSHAAAANPGQDTTQFSSPPGAPHDSRATATEPAPETGNTMPSSAREEEPVLGHVSLQSNGHSSPKRPRPSRTQDVCDVQGVLLDAPENATASGDHLTHPVHRTSQSATSGDDDGPVSPTVAFGGQWQRAGSVACQGIV